MELSSSLARARNGELVRGASQILTGGAAVVGVSDPQVPSLELSGGDEVESAEPLVRRQSTVQNVGQAQREVHARVMEEVMQTTASSLQMICPLFFAAFVLLLAVIAIYSRALLALIQNSNKPCDQPLAYYFVVSVVSGMVVVRTRPLIARALAPEAAIDDAMQTVSQRVDAMFKAMIVTNLFGFITIFWGIYMVTQSKTCPVTNPDLYYPTRLLIHTQAVLTLVTIAIQVIISYGFTTIALPLLAKLNSTHGCESAVHQFPKIAAGAPELVDENGVENACPICLQPFPEGAVKTPCEHFYHEECLAQWCKSHLDCPLCRQALGEADPH